MSDDREIVSLRDKEDDFVIYGRVHDESPDTIWLGPNHTRCYTKKFYALFRNLKAKPHKWFGRACEGCDEEQNWTKGVYLCETKTEWPHKILREKGTISHWKHIRFLDETPDIKITVEINGETSSLSDISEETLLKIRNQK